MNTENGENLFKLHYNVDADDFSRAGEVSSNVKKTLQQLGISPETVRKVSIAMYEGEINMVIHARGGVIDVEIWPDKIRFVLDDNGPGIQNLELAMQEGYSTANENIRQLGFGAGMGLPNMKKYTDKLEVTVTPGKGTKVDMTVNIT